MITTHRHDRIALVTFENPPVNALSVANGTVQALTEAIRGALEDPSVAAIVVKANGRGFSAGADIGDFDTRPDALDLMRALTSDVVEASAKPVVAAVHGMALGGGLELALSAHYRICTPEAKFALPEVKLGLLPGAGGTQRLPRLIGAQRALDMMVTGKTVSAQYAFDNGFVDRVAARDLTNEALSFAAELVGATPRRACDGAPSDRGAVDFAAARKAASKRTLSQAPGFIVDCVEAACTKPFADGMALEKDLFGQLRTSDASAGLRHVFWGAREVGKIPGLEREAVPGAATSIAIVGGGLMGTGIAIALLSAGKPVTLIEPREDAREKAAKAVAAALRRDVEKGRLTPEIAAARGKAFTVAADMTAAAEADLVIEAVYEDMGVKEQVFTALDKAAKPSAILASNTSTLDLNAIAAFTKRPAQVVGTHFFSPATVMPLIEIVRGEKTSPQTLLATLAFTKAVGKIGVISGVCDGFIGNRMFEEYLRQAYFLLEDGALPAQVDGALERWGMALGPLKVMDLAGQDIGWSIRKRRAIEQPDRPYSKIPDLICEQGRFGQKTGAGYYLYPDGRTATIDPAIDDLVRSHSASIGVDRRAITDEEIVERCIFALVNEGAKILEEKIAFRAVDVDMVYVNGYGFPAERGGPMFYADRLGSGHVLAEVEKFAGGANGWAWAPAPLLVRLAKAGRGFADAGRA